MIIILFLSVLTGSPWDWQSMNAKYPSDHSRSNLPAYGSTKPFPEIMPVNANVSVFESHTALLPCRIKQLQEYTVNLGNDFYEYIYRIRVIAAPGFYFSIWVFGWGLIQKIPQKVDFLCKEWGCIQEKPQKLDFSHYLGLNSRVGLQ